MKKITIGLIPLFLGLLFINATTCYASHIDKQLNNIYEEENEFSVSSYTQNNHLDFDYQPTENLKDPKLIKITNYIPITDAEYKKKLKDDEKKYAKQESHFKNTYAGQGAYRIYRITERIIRANNLDYINWRIAPSYENDFNACTSNANLITVFSGVADSFSDNDDALAFIIAHEFSHQILGHYKRRQALEKKTTYFNPNSIPGKSAQLMYYKQCRMMEYMADAEALVLIKRAGYSIDRAMECMSYLKELNAHESSDVQNTHPNSKNRIASIRENAQFLNPEWVEEGKYNIYNSNVLNVEGGINKQLMIIIRDPESKTFYKPETFKTRIMRIAYVSYLKGDMENAIKYFEKVTEKEPTNYIAYLYISYANEYLYKTTGNTKYLKEAEKAVSKAQKYCSSNKHVKQQIKELKNL